MRHLKITALASMLFGSMFLAPKAIAAEASLLPKLRVILHEWECQVEDVPEECDIFIFVNYYECYCLELEFAETKIEQDYLILK